MTQPRMITPGATHLVTRRPLRSHHLFAPNDPRIRQLSFGDHAERIALYVYPGDFEVRGLARSGTGYEPAAGGHVETQYVVAGARLAWRHATGTALDEAHNCRLTDLIQTTAATLDLLSGELVEASTYYPNGARETALADSESPSALEPIGFTGKEAEEEVGLVYFGERYLISRIVRWTAPDPLHVHRAGGGEALNAYHYVGGSPLSRTDPVGLQMRSREDGAYRSFGTQLRATPEQGARVRGALTAILRGAVVGIVGALVLAKAPVVALGLAAR